MKRTFLAIACLCCLAANGFGQTAEDPEFFEAAGLFRIGSPHPSFQWRKQTTQKTEVTTAHYFVCTDNPSSTPLILSVDERVADEGFPRQTLVLENYKVARAIAEKHGFKVIKGKTPDLTDAENTRVTYSVVAEHPTQKHEGKPVEMYIGGITVFSKYRTYTFQAIAPTADSTKQLLSVAKTLKEIPPAK